MNTVKVKPWGEGQGDHVLINEADFDPARHELFDASDAPAGDLAILRQQYEEKLGKRPFMGWDADTLTAKIAEADA